MMIQALRTAGVLEILFFLLEAVGKVKISREKLTMARQGLF